MDGNGRPRNECLGNRLVPNTDVYEYFGPVGSAWARATDHRTKRVTWELPARSVYRVSNSIQFHSWINLMIRHQKKAPFARALEIKGDNDFEYYDITTSLRKIC